MIKYYVSFLSLVVSSTALISDGFAKNLNSITEDFVLVSPSSLKKLNTAVDLPCEDTSHTILSIGNENDLSSVKKVNRIVDEFVELIAPQPQPMNSAGGPLDKLASSLERELQALKELEYKFAAPIQPSGFFSYFKMGSWKKSKELMDKKRSNYNKQIVEVEELLKKSKAKLELNPKDFETDLKLFEVNASRAIKGTINYVSWAIDGQKVDSISQRIYETWINGTKPAYTK